MTHQIKLVLALCLAQTGLSLHTTPDMTPLVQKNGARHPAARHVSRAVKQPGANTTAQPLSRSAHKQALIAEGQFEHAMAEWQAKEAKAVAATADAYAAFVTFYGDHASKV
eukprot:CAMPEP_0168377306 /NCGR_PEP_ID=MMETSP0228-20121227/10757_1 /TAXON_ID=133427 /ORGANISM="Protoceratium reticulatum, Strain CCCM 535 (=CCMP 1889)" /LENGTH=110 /DNA_ID=CAMNT_0008390297 /DNA_START=32 /DNA_END=360 /DNA_ORIENTATION=-